MASRSRRQRVAKAAGFSLGASALAALVWLASRPKAPDVACGALEGALKAACAARLETPATLPPPTPDQIKPDAQGGCPGGAEARDGGCWTPLEKPPPCPVVYPSYPSDGKCWIIYPAPRVPRPNASGPRGR